MMNHRILTLMFLSIGLLGPAAHAQRPPITSVPSVNEIQQRVDQVRDEIAVLADEFDLSPAQSAALLAVFDHTSAEMRVVVEDMIDQRLALREVLMADVVDQARVDEIARAQGNSATTLSALGADATVDVLSILDEDQIMIVAELKATARDLLEQVLTVSAVRVESRASRRMATLRRFPNAGDRLGDIADAYGLSAAQRADLREVAQNYAPSILVLAADLIVNRQAIVEAASNAPVDSGAIAALTEAQGDLVRELVGLQAAIVIDMRNVLTTEQQGALGDLRAEFQQRILALLFGK